MKTYDYQSLALRYIIPYLRTNTDITAILYAVGETFNNLQEAVEELLTQLNLHNARGVWLDKIGAEVGAERDEKDFGDYFCVNRSHINSEKYFYFTTSCTDPESTISLGDAEYIQKILAYIGTNNSSGTREEVINIIKTITGASKVIIKEVDTNVLSINIIGEQILLTQNTLNYIRGTVADGISISTITLNAEEESDTAEETDAGENDDSSDTDGLESDSDSSTDSNDESDTGTDDTDDDSDEDSDTETDDTVGSTDTDTESDTDDTSTDVDSDDTTDTDNTTEDE